MDYQTQKEYDTTYIDLSKSQIKYLHDEVFGQVIRSDEAINMVVKIELAYIPFLLFIIIMVTAINLRWNKAYKRIVAVSKDAPTSEETEKKISQLKILKLNLWDRFFVYFVIWGSSLYIDVMMMSSGIFTYPWVSIPVIIFVIFKKLRRLTQTSSLIGVDDSDILANFEEILKDMIVTPLMSGVSEWVKNYLKKE